MRTVTEKSHLRRFASFCSDSTAGQKNRPSVLNETACHMNRIPEYIAYGMDPKAQYAVIDVEIY